VSKKTPFRKSAYENKLLFGKVHCDVLNTI
jgi:hypothetical protein